MDRTTSDKVQQTNQLSNRPLAGILVTDFYSRNRWEMIYGTMSKLALVPSRFLIGCSHVIITLELGNQSLKLAAYLLLTLKARMRAPCHQDLLETFIMFLQGASATYWLSYFYLGLEIQWKALRDHPQTSQTKSKVGLLLCPHPTNFILNHILFNAF